MDEDVKEKILNNAWKTKFRCSTIQLLSLILEYSTTGDMKYIHKALSFMNSSLVEYNTTLIEDDFHKTKLLRNLFEYNAKEKASRYTEYRAYGETLSSMDFLSVCFE